MQSHPPRPPACPTPQTPGSAKPPTTRETPPVSDTAPHTCQTPAPMSHLRAVRAPLPRARSTPAAARKTALLPAPLELPAPCPNCNLTPGLTELQIGHPWPAFGHSQCGTAIPGCARSNATTPINLRVHCPSRGFSAKGGSSDRTERFSFRSLFCSGQGTRNTSHVSSNPRDNHSSAKGRP